MSYKYPCVLAVLSVLLVGAIGMSQEAKKPTTKVSVAQTGAVQGMWAENASGVLAVITQNARSSNGDDPSPYVCIYVKNADGKIDMPAPYAMNFDHNEVHLQIPIGKVVKIVPMRKIIDLLNADESKKSVPLGVLPSQEK